MDTQIPSNPAPSEGGQDNLKNFLILAIVIVLAVAIFVLMPKKDQGPDQPAVTVTDFHECEEAGYPVQESYPRKCTVPGGQTYTEDLSENAEVILETPTRGAVVTSPLTVKGKAKGTWFFEANIPVTLKDQSGKVIAQKGAQAKGDWMTEDYVEFEVVLEFPAQASALGVLLVEKDNPSGLPENDLSYAIPVRFRE